MNGVEPYAWLESIPKAIATGHTNSHINDLLP